MVQSLPMAFGDQVYVYRDLLNLSGVYEHHGIDCGDGSVIHYRKPSEIVEQTSIEIFARGNRVYQRQYRAEFCYLPEIVIDRAVSRLGEQKYNLLFNNCEHFATWCKTGKNESQQIKEFVPFALQLDPDRLYDPLKQAADAQPQKGKQLLEGALGDLKVTWNDLQPRYKQALKETKSWQKVAEEAVKRDRDDLARAALIRKLEYQKQSDRLHAQLTQLATLTEDVLSKLIQASS
jgi:hypothetical protein